MEHAPANTAAVPPSDRNPARGSKPGAAPASLLRVLDKALAWTALCTAAAGGLAVTAAAAVIQRRRPS